MKKFYKILALKLKNNDCEEYKNKYIYRISKNFML